MSLPYPILKELWEAGYAGKVIRVPVMNDKGMLKARADELLADVEELYEEKGTTFVFEKRGRSDFYRSFGVLRLCRRFHLDMNEAKRVRRRVYWRWFRWVRTSEEPKLKVADRFGVNGEGKERYLEVRRRIRVGEPMDGREPQELVRMAEESVRGVTWR